MYVYNKPITMKHNLSPTHMGHSLFYSLKVLVTMEMPSFPNRVLGLNH